MPIYKIFAKFELVWDIFSINEYYSLFVELWYGKEEGTSFDAKIKNV